MEVVRRIRLYFCPDCGSLVSCTRKKRLQPDRVCRPERCVDYAKCRIRTIYSVGKVKSMIADPAKKRKFYTKYSVHYVLCGGCRTMENLFGTKAQSDKLTI